MGKHGPYQVSGVRGKIVSGRRTYVYHGIGPDGIEIAAVWYDERTGKGLRDAHDIVRACNSYGPLLEALEAITRFHASGGHEGRWSEVEAKANAAIALAKGGGA